MKALAFFLILQISFVLQGCVVLDYFRGTSEEHGKSAELIDANLQKQIDALEQENKILREENEERLSRAGNENKRLNEEIKGLHQENRRITDQNKLLKDQIDKRKFEKKILSQSNKTKKSLNRLIIKVLSGDGDIGSAEKMAKKLKNMGYTVKSIDYAPRANFLRDTVYFAPEFRNEAERFVSRLGGNKVLKPLTWSSAFDLIVVTGRNP